MYCVCACVSALSLIRITYLLLYAAYFSRKRAAQGKVKEKRLQALVSALKHEDEGKKVEGALASLERVTLGDLRCVCVLRRGSCVSIHANVYIWGNSAYRLDKGNNVHNTQNTPRRINRQGGTQPGKAAGAQAGAPLRAADRAPVLLPRDRRGEF